ncbi:ABC transporter [Streptomyces sp. TRM66268-LWL]|uniref:ABC transporter n=1 Tax=Streptomyces polyasparticus TaxID=2767826 RepID=A0ABR7SCD8_9ACTN|nr:ABC transporter [Streptomyces polyasparticus]MBC9713088.1 ABC transporter [Streptomyces polyasparticus]
MTALLGYHTALLLRSQRWLPPVVLYGALLAVGVGMGDPLLDSLGYAAAALLPVAAWLVRICATQEPYAARHVTATAAGGPVRAQLAVLVTALAAAGLLGAVGTVLTVLLGDARTTDRTAAIPLPGALASGLLAAAVCALTGAALGALCTWPVLTGRGWSLAALSLGALLLLVTAGSPARTAVSALISGSRTGDTPLSLLPLAAAAAVATAAAALSCGLSSRRT